MSGFAHHVKQRLTAGFGKSIWIRILNGLQVQKWVLFGTSGLALALAIFLFPLWLQIFTTPNRTVKVQMLAPAGEVVRAYWDDPQRHPDAYTPIRVNPLANQQWQVEIGWVGEKNPRSGAAQVTVLEISTPEQMIDWADQSSIFIPHLAWYIEPPNRTGAGGISANLQDPEAMPLDASLTGSKLKLKFLRHPNAGKAKIKVNDEVRIVDLYAAETGIREVHFPSRPLKQKTYEIAIVDTSWHRLKLVPESQRPIQVEQIQIEGQRLKSASDQTFRLPQRFWNRQSRAIVSTVLSWFIMTLLLISTVHLWQNVGTRRIGITFYILVLPVILGGFWMLVFHPAYMTLDSINQWQQAVQNRYHNWYPPIMAMMMHLTLPFSDSPNLFAFVQGTLFWFAILFALRQVVTSERFFLIAATVLIFLPPLWPYGPLLVNNTFTATFALIALGLLIRAINQQNWSSFWASIGFLALAICFRREAIFILLVPLLVSQLMLGSRRRLFHRLVSLLLVLVIVYLPSKLITQIPNFNSSNPVSYVFVSQYVGTLANTKLTPAEAAAEKQAVDQQFGAGMFDFFMQNYQCQSGDGIWLSKTGGTTFANTPENTQFVLRKVLEVAIRHPVGFIQHRICNLAYTLQLPVVSYYWGIVGDPVAHDLQLQQGGIQPGSRLPALRAWVLNTIQTLINNPVTPILFLHWVFMIMLALNLILGLWFRETGIWLSASVGLTYFAGFLIPDSFPSWRYLLLCYLCSLISIAALVDYIRHKQKRSFARGYHN